MLEGLELCHPDSHHGQVVGLGDSLSLGVKVVQNAEGDGDLVFAWVDEVASGSPGGDLPIVERSVLGEVKHAISVGVSGGEISASFSHHLLHSFGALLHGCHESSVNSLLFLGGSSGPVL